MSRTSDWEIRGAESQTIFGTSYIPEAAPVGCAIVAHGFKGYKDFRMIPPIAAGLCSAGFVAQAFNFSHSGMTANPDTFERPDLFELDTWNKQVLDIQSVVQAIANGQLAGTGLPYVIVGHSRGGVSTIFFAGRQTTGSRLPKPAGVITVSAPDCACSLSDSERDDLRAKGFLESPSARTGQMLRIGLQWLTEQEADPDSHDLLANVRRIECPLLVVHGENDETVDVENADSIASAAVNAKVARIASCNHVYNTPNPPPSSVDEIPALAEAIDQIVKFSRDCCGAA